MGVGAFVGLSGWLPFRAQISAASLPFRDDVEAGDPQGRRTRAAISYVCKLSRLARSSRRW